jgi:hypothetical protein
MTDRIQYDGDDLSEIVLTGVTLHLERLSHHDWHLAAYRDGQDLLLDFSTSLEPDLRATEWPGVERIDHDRLPHPCPTRWAHLGKHQCDRAGRHKGRHKCECGAQKA